MLLMVQGCGLYTRYERAELPETDSLYNKMTRRAADDTISIATMSWKEMFTDHQLQQLIERGLRANLDLNLARLKVEETKAVLQASRLAYVPTLSLEARGGAASFGGDSGGPTWNAGASAAWEVDIFGRLTSEKRQAFASYEESQAYAQAVQTQLVAAIASSYYQLLRKTVKEK